MGERKAEPKKDQAAEVGNERVVPGQSSRVMDEHASGELADVARQQGTSQRGYTADGDGAPGTKTSGDPGR
ncbi:hypothetical protein [Polyangium aurulentum]|uniref:hypothetical protein n=1 Tax=Polyangium aurulentum TaxID=2567896 RepID=UPI0010AEE97A|nr:hypothetical protein [Polyangium aurulentum]UQA59784.1 hypothetical protein E8A73_004595 [Polyangium aurulentum]